MRIGGVLAKPQNNMFNSNSVSVYVPYSTVSTRFTGSQRLQSMTVRVRDEAGRYLFEAEPQRATMPTKDGIVMPQLMWFMAMSSVMPEAQRRR